MDMIWKTGDLLAATSGEQVCGTGEPVFSGIGIDSRTIEADGVFVAIQGENHDGHDFAPQVVDQGIRGLVLSRHKLESLPLNRWRQKGVTCVAVADTTQALGDLGRYHRRRSPASVVAITGSNGKTTTKEMAAAVLGTSFSTLATPGNLNNAIGLPLTLFGLSSAHQWAVVELGMNHPGEMTRLARICEPDVAVITNIGPAHLEGLGSLDGVMHGKGELLAELAEGGTAVLNADDPRTRQLARIHGPRLRVLSFGMSPEADVRGGHIRSHQDGGLRFDLILAQSALVPVRLQVPGRFMVANALAAAGVGHVAGLDGERIARGLASFQAVKGRMRVRTAPSGLRIIDDSYNANPGSAAAALQTLQELRGADRGFAVFGDMYELGAAAESLHREIGALAARFGVSGLYLTGKMADAVADGAIAGGFDPDRIFQGSKAQLLDRLKAVLAPTDWVLVKGSRAMAMEAIADALRHLN